MLCFTGRNSFVISAQKILLSNGWLIYGYCVIWNTTNSTFLFFLCKRCCWQNVLRNKFWSKHVAYANYDVWFKIFSIHNIACDVYTLYTVFVYWTYVLRSTFERCNTSKCLVNNKHCGLRLYTHCVNLPHLNDTIVHINEDNIINTEQLINIEQMFFSHTSNLHFGIVKSLVVDVISIDANWCLGYPLFWPFHISSKLRGNLLRKYLSMNDFELIVNSWQKSNSPLCEGFRFISFRFVHVCACHTSHSQFYLKKFNNRTDLRINMRLFHCPQNRHYMMQTMKIAKCILCQRFIIIIYHSIKSN